MSLNQLNFDGKNKVEMAIMRLRQFCPPEGYYLAFSGGKDSTVLYDLAVKSGVKFDAHYQRTGIDPPELVYFIRDNYPNVIWEKPEITMWEGIYTHGLPSRLSRWCCEKLKETGGSGRTVITGVRWSESPRRKTWKMYSVCHSDITKRFLHPVIDFTTKDVWDYIHQNNLPYCSLYDFGFKRLGCVLCPMETAKQKIIEANRYPRLAEAWRKSAFRYWEKGTKGARKYSSPQAFWDWYMRCKGEPKGKDAQCTMFG
jgi:phosphoadenosine phosphosulfate reductase